MIKISFNNVYQLTDDGETLFDDVFFNQRKFKSSDLTNSKYAIPLKNTNKWKVTSEDNSYEVAKELVNALGGKNKCFTFQEDNKLWKWLTLALFEMVVQSDKSGIKKTKIESSTGSIIYGQSARYDPIPMSDYLTAMRHLIRTPVLFYANLGKDSEHILHNKLHSPGELREQFTQSPYFNRQCFARVFKKLYWNQDSSSLKKGIAGKGSGSARDLVRVLKQLMVTQCLENMDEHEIIQTLPQYFVDKWS